MADRENKSTSELEENISLHEMFQVIGNQMTARDVRVLKYVYSGIFSPQMRARINDGATFFLALEKIGRCDASNFKHILHLLRIISRHDLTQYVSLRRRYPGMEFDHNALYIMFGCVCVVSFMHSFVFDSCITLLQLKVGNPPVMDWKFLHMKLDCHVCTPGKRTH